jgi:hypothetical protein
MFQCKLIRAAALAASAGIAGCVSTAHYDKSWAQQVEVDSGACPNLDGRYQNAGELSVKAHDGSTRSVDVSLADLLNAWGEPGTDLLRHDDDNRLGSTHSDPAQDPYQSVTLRHADGKLHVVATDAQGVTRSFALLTSGRCRASTLLLKASWANSETFGLLLSLVQRESLALGKAEDGSLLVRRGDARGAFVLQWPILAFADGDWMRFAPTAPDIRQAALPTN